MALLETAKQDEFQTKKMKFFNFPLKMGKLVVDEATQAPKYLELQIDDVKVRLTKLNHFSLRTNATTGEKYWHAGFMWTFKYSIGDMKVVTGEVIMKYILKQRKQAVAAKKLVDIPLDENISVVTPIEKPKKSVKTKE